MHNLSIIDLTIIVMYFVFSGFIALLRYKPLNNINDYTLSVENRSALHFSIIILSTLMGASATIGVMESLYEHGIRFAIMIAALPVAWFVLSHIISPRIQKFKGCISIGDVMHLLYGKEARWITNIFSIILTVGITAIQIHVMGNIISYCFHTDKILSEILVTIFIVSYSSWGGIRTINSVDKFFFLTFAIMIPIVCIVGMNSSAINDLNFTIPRHFESLQIHNFQDITSILSGIIFFLIPSFSPVFIQRCLAAKDSKQLRNSLQLMSVMYVVFLLCFILLTILIKSIYNDLAFNIAIMKFLSYDIPHYISGFAIAGILAIIMSTADSWLNTASVICAHDIWHSIYPNSTQKQELIVARICNVALGAIAVTISFSMTNLIEMLFLINNFWKPIILIPILVGILSNKIKKSDFLFSTVFALTFTIATAYYTSNLGTISILSGIIGSAVGFMISKQLKYIPGIENKERIKNLFLSLSYWSLVRRARNDMVKSIFIYKSLSKKYKFILIFCLLNYIIPIFTIYNNLPHQENFINHLYILSLALIFIMITLSKAQKYNVIPNIKTLYHALNIITIFYIFIALPTLRLMIYEFHNISIITSIISFCILVSLTHSYIKTFAISLAIFAIVQLFFHQWTHNIHTYIAHQDIFNTYVQFFNLFTSFILLFILLLIRSLKIQIIQTSKTKLSNPIDDLNKKIEEIKEASMKITQISEYIKVTAYEKHSRIDYFQLLNNIKQQKNESKFSRFFNFKINNLSQAWYKNEDNEIILRISKDIYKEIVYYIPKKLLESSSKSEKLMRYIMASIKNRYLKIKDKK